MSDDISTWTGHIDYARTHGLLGKRLYVVLSEPTNGLAPVLENADVHVAYQKELEARGVMFAAGPLAEDDEEHWGGDGIFIYRADSRQEAHEIASADPMHKNGARRFRVRPWLMNEGRIGIDILFSGGGYTLR